MSGDTEGFRAKILKSGKLSGLKFLSDVGLRLVSTVVLTRLLDPEIYGVFAVVMVYLYLLEMFSDLGVRTLILTKEDGVSDRFVRTCWTVMILRGGVVAGASCLIGLVIGLLQMRGVFAPDSSYAEAVLPWAIAALGGTSLMFACQTPMRFMQERDMRFGRVTGIDVAANVFALVVTIALAFYLRSIWALVLGQVIKALFYVPLTFVVFPGMRLRPSFNREDFDILIGRGKWIVGHSILTAIAQSADRLLLGLVMSSSTFGFYFIARQLVDMVAQFLNAVNAQVGMQVFTHIGQSEPADFRRNYYRYRLFFDALAGLSAGGLIVVVPLLVSIMFDDRYGDVAPIVQILAPGILLTGMLLLRSAYSAERRFREMTLLSIMSTLTLWAGLLAAVLVFDSIIMALIVVAFYRLPEALFFLWAGNRRDWVIPWREGLGLVFAGVGAVLGWLLLLVWDLVT